MAYRVCSVLSPGKMHHAINAGEGGISAVVSVMIELLLGQDVAARLYIRNPDRLEGGNVIYQSC